MIAAYQRISRADGDLGKDGKDKSNSMMEDASWFGSNMSRACRTLARSIKVGKLGVLVPLSR